MRVVMQWLSIKLKSTCRSCASPKVPLHFLIKVTASDENCHRPGFVNPTPDNGECLPAAVDQPKTIRLAARSENSQYV